MMPELLINKLCGAILETVQEAGPLGAPSGPMYLALNKLGLTLDSYTSLMAALTQIGLLYKSGDCYTLTPKGEDYLTNDGRNFSNSSAV
jgi:hypothetical protein